MRRFVVLYVFFYRKKEGRQLYVYNYFIVCDFCFVIRFTIHLIQWIFGEFVRLAKVFLKLRVRSVCLLFCVLSFIASCIQRPTSQLADRTSAHIAFA